MHYIFLGLPVINFDIKAPSAQQVRGIEFARPGDHKLESSTGRWKEGRACKSARSPREGMPLGQAGRQGVAHREPGT